MNKVTAFFKHPVIAVFIFYGWNILGILSLIIVEINAHPISDLIGNVIHGYTPALYLFQVLFILAIPLLCFVVGILRFKKHYGHLLRWFYGVEVPLMVLGAVRIIAVNDLTGHAFWFFLYGLTAILAYAWFLLFPHRFKDRAEVFFRIFFLFIGLQVITFLLLYIIPLTVLFFKSLQYLSLDDINEFFTAGLMVIVLGVFVAMSGTLFLLSPIAFLWMWVVENGRALWHKLKTVPGLRYIGLATLCLVLWVIFPAKQDQEYAFEAYTEYQRTNDASVILGDEGNIRAGLVNAYLHSYRYIDRRGKRPVSPLYNKAFGSKWKAGDRIHDFLLDALLYHGERNEDEKASEIYQELFDAPIERSERKDILYTLGSAFQPRAGEATLLSIDQKQVLVTDRDISYEEIEPGWVQVDLHERYINKTSRQQEIFYYFSLPESGVITGMWLGDDDSIPKKYPAQVSPRGAAQAVYKEIRAVRQDPALLEQVGPNQYRLRVFPIPERPWRSSRFEEDELEEERPMHLSLRLLLKTNASGKIQFPVLNEKRKVYWKDGVMENCSEEDWFPKESPVFSPAKEISTQVFSGWMAEQKSREELPEQDVKQNYVFCFDGSYSMNANRKKLTEALGQFPYQETTPLYVFDRTGLKRTEWAEKTRDIRFLGAVDPYRAIKELQHSHPQAHLVFISDKGSYELMPDSSRSLAPGDNTIDIIHLGEMAPIYEDAIADAVRESGGDMYQNMESWLSWHKRIPQVGSIGVRDGGTYWSFARDKSSGASRPVLALAASRLAMAQSKKADLHVSGLDSLHHLAMTYSFVSPYSSMICLVNDAQQKRLDELSRGVDRYQREVETGKDSGNNFEIGAKGVPEPEEWVMIILGGGLLVLLYWKKRGRTIYEL